MLSFDVQNVILLRGVPKIAFFSVLTFFTIWAIIRKVLRAEIQVAHGSTTGIGGPKWVGLWKFSSNHFL